MNRNDIKKLESHVGYPAISVFVPTHRTIPQRLQDPIRVKDMLAKATRALALEFSKNELLPIVQAFDRLAEEIDYTTTLDGLAFFVSRNFAQVYRLPFEIEESIVIDKMFNIKPLLYALNRSPLYWVLVVSDNMVRLFSGTFNKLEEIINSQEDQEQEKGFPFSRHYDVTNDKKLLAVGTGDEDAGYLSNFKTKFMEQADTLLDAYITPDNRPLILLGTEKNIAYFKKISKHANAIIVTEQGSFSNANIDQIAQSAWPLLENYLDNQANLIVTEFTNSIHKIPTTFGLQEIWYAAYMGQVRVLLVEKNYEAYGTQDAKAPFNILVVDPQEAQEKHIDQNLVDSLIELVLSKDGRVIFVAPNALDKYNHIAALLRY